MPTNPMLFLNRNTYKIKIMENLSSKLMIRTNLSFLQPQASAIIHTFQITTHNCLKKDLKRAHFRFSMDMLQ